MPWARPNASPSRVMLERQSTTVPNTSKPSAFTSGGTEHLHFRQASLDANGGQRFELHAVLQPAHRVAAHEDFAADILREALDARREVHGIADERVRQTLGAADRGGDHLAGVNADAVAQHDRARGLA